MNSDPAQSTRGTIRRWFLIVACVIVLLCLAYYGNIAYQQHMLHSELDRIIAELDANDPG